MSYLKNLNGNINSLHDLIKIIPNQIISKSLSDYEGVDIRLFALAKDEFIRNEIYPMDTIYFLIEGDIEVIKCNEKYELKEKDFLSVFIGEDSFIKANKDSIMLQIMIRGN